MKTFKIPFALDGNNDVVDIRRAIKTETYKCTCGSDVKMRGGEKVSNHFYHLVDKECSLESSIHKAYKFILQKVKAIKLPYVVDGVDTLVFDRVELEKQIGDFIPDAIGYIGETKYLIEFAKTSYIGERKENKIKKCNLFCIEIPIMTEYVCFEQIENHLLNETYYKEIINIPEYEDVKILRAKFANEYRKLLHENMELKSEIEQQKKKSKDKRILSEMLAEAKSLQEKEEILNESHQTIINDLLNVGFSLYHKTDCSNGAKMYVYQSNFVGIRNVVAFQKGNKITLKYQN